MTFRAILPGLLALGALMGAAFQDKSAKEIMVAANKGKESLWAKVTGGKGQVKTLLIPGSDGGSKDLGGALKP